MTTLLAILEIVFSFVPYILVSITVYKFLKNLSGQHDRKSTEIEWDVKNNTCKIYKDGNY